MISAETLKELDERKIPYILGARMRRVTGIKEDVLSHPGQYQEVYPEGKSSKDPAPLKVKEVSTGGSRYIVCHNSRQARKDAQDRQAIINSLQEKIKSVVDTRPVYHQRDENITGHIFCSFLALVLRKELDRRLEKCGHSFEWVDIKQDLKSLQEVVIEDNGKSLALRTECIGTPLTRGSHVKGTCGKVFQAVGVAIPPTIREVKA